MNTSENPAPQFLYDILLNNLVAREITAWKKSIASKFSSKARRRIRTGVTIIVVIGALLYGVFSLINWKNEYRINAVEADKTFTNSPTPIPSPSPQIQPLKTDCDQREWLEFTDDKWEHLSWFTQVNGVYSLPSEHTVKDITTEYKTPCKGGIIYSVRFIPITAELIDLNMYFGNWFRWEIGGNDRRSVRLYKNTLGCAAMKDVVEISTKKKYLDNHRVISLENPVTASMSAYLTETGKARTEVFLTYIDENSGEEFTENGFEYEFEVNPSCGENYTANKILNIDENEERFKIGLMKSSWYPEVLPSVKLIEYRIAKRGEDDSLSATQ